MSVSVHKETNKLNGIISNTSTSENKVVLKPQANTWLHFIAGGSGGFIGTIIFSPLEVIKTRFQSSLYSHNLKNPISKTGILNNAKFHVLDTLGAIRGLYQTEGIRALFKGLGPTLSGVVPSRSIYFFSYGNGKQFYTNMNGGQENALIHLASAATAGTITATITNPIWVIRTRMQLQSESARKYRNSLHCAYEVLRKEGTRGLYKGLTASYLGVIESSLQWVVYESLKSKVAMHKTKAGSVTGSKSASDWRDTLVCAGVAKLFAAVVAYPHEVLRTRLRQGSSMDSKRNKYTGLIQSVRLICKEEGVVGLYSGMTPHLLRVVPNAAVLFGTYEMIMYYFGNHK